MHDTLDCDGLTVTIIETPTLGDRSYVIDDRHQALVIDPQRDIDRVQAVLESRGVTLAAVEKTHARNDYVSGGLGLARRGGSAYLVPCEGSRAQHLSVRRLAHELPDRTAVLPTHGFGSFCSATLTSGTASTIEQQRRENPALTQDENQSSRRCSPASTRRTTPTWAR